MAFNYNDEVIDLLLKKSMGTAYTRSGLVPGQETQVLEFLEEIKNSPHYEDYAEPLMEMVNFGKDSDHVYNPAIMKQYVEITNNYDIFRGHDIMTVAPEFKRIQDEI